MRSRFAVFFLFLILLLTLVLLFIFRKPLKLFSRAVYRKANLVVDARQVSGRLQYNWKALAQGGEESGVRMLENVVPQITLLEPRYIRLDHIYDFYNIIKRDSTGQLSYDWSQFDQTICDIYKSGAKPFLVLGYMPSVLSGDNSLISIPKSWDEWALTVQKTVERYSGKDTRLCGGVYGDLLKDVYYEVWNEPDLETFGKWSIWGGGKDYKTLYYYSSRGAQSAQNVQNFFFGGPAVTRAGYWNRNWFVNLIDYVKLNNLRLDFFSWHHYSKEPDDYAQEVAQVKKWVEPYGSPYDKLPLIISEWGYNSDPDPISETNLGAAHTVMTIRNLVEEHLEMAFAFEIKDGHSPRWGILSYEGKPKPRYYALKLLNDLQGYRLAVDGEGSNVKALAAKWLNKIIIVLVNYDQENKNLENVPLTVTNLSPGTYEIYQNSLAGENLIETVNIENTLQKLVLMPANSVVSLQIIKK